MPEGFAHSQETKTNQFLFLSFLNASGYIASNTYFMKPQHKLTTHVDPIPQSNIQMDYILIHHTWKNGILDVSAGDRHCLDTAHNLLLGIFAHQVSRRRVEVFSRSHFAISLAATRGPNSVRTSSVHSGSTEPLNSRLRNLDESLDPRSTQLFLCQSPKGT